MRPPRLRLRTLLIAVAVVGAALGGFQMGQKRALCLWLAEQYVARVNAHASILDNLAKLREDHRATIEECRALRRQAGPGLSPGRAAELDLIEDRSIEAIRDYELAASEERERLQQDSQLLARYRHIARFPWLRLPSDPYWTW